MKQDEDMRCIKNKIGVSSVLLRGVLFSLVWWILTDGSVASWWIGVPAVLISVAASVALLPAVPLAWPALLRFVPFFLVRSFLGGVDVARRAFHPDLPIDPALIAYPLRLSPGLPRVFMLNTVTLLPGTLSAALERDVLQVHVLDAQADFIAELEAVEQSVARIFCLTLKSQ